MQQGYILQFLDGVQVIELVKSFKSEDQYSDNGYWSSNSFYLSYYFSLGFIDGFIVGFIENLLIGNEFLIGVF